jgi:hypothetical protein
MPSNYASVKLSSDFVDEARQEASTLHRSVGAQVEYWAKLGRAIENAPGFNIHQAREALAGGKLDGLSVAQQDLLLDRLGEDFDAPSAELREHFAALGARDGAVGSNEKGQLVRRQASGRVRRIG